MVETGSNAGGERIADGGDLSALKEAAGDERAVGQVLNLHRDRLRRIVAFRMDHRLQGRVDPSDIIQDTYLEASRRLDDYLGQPKMPLFLWLRFLAEQCLAGVHRHHLGRQKRTPELELSIGVGASAGDTSEAIANQLIADQTDPAERVSKEETFDKLRAALEGMDATDREILALRHFEELTNAEAAAVLDLQPSAASKRYMRALDRLRQILTQFRS